MTLPLALGEFVGADRLLGAIATRRRHHCAFSQCRAAFVVQLLGAAGHVLGFAVHALASRQPVHNPVIDHAVQQAMIGASGTLIIYEPVHTLTGEEGLVGDGIENTGPRSPACALQAEQAGFLKARILGHAPACLQHRIARGLEHGGMDAVLAGVIGQEVLHILIVKQGP